MNYFSLFPIKIEPNSSKIFGYFMFILISFRNKWLIFELIEIDSSQFLIPCITTKHFSLDFFLKLCLRNGSKPRPLCVVHGACNRTGFHTHLIVLQRRQQNQEKAGQNNKSVILQDVRLMIEFPTFYSCVNSHFIQIYSAL